MAKGAGGASSARRRTAPKGCYWRGDTLWGRFRVAGQEYRLSLRTGSAAIAERRLADERARVVAHARYGAAGPVTWRAAVVAWRSEICDRIGTSTLTRYQSSLRTVAVWLDGMELHAIKRETLRAMVSARRNTGASVATIRRDLTAVASVLEVAEDREWIDTNPARELARRLVERRDPIVLPDERSIAAVLAECPPELARLAQAARLTGLRQSELVDMKRSAVDYGRGAIQVTRSKTGRARAVPLSADAAAVLRANPPFIGCPYVFHEGGEAMRNVSRRFAEFAGRAARKWAQRNEPIVRFRFHDLRHLFAVEELRRAPDIYRLRDVLGHTTVKMTEGYLAYLTPAEAAAARTGVGTKSGTGGAVYDAAEVA